MQLVIAVDAQASINIVLQGITCINAPGEGEATCAALVEADLADAVLSSDVVDSLLFGADKVVHAKNAAHVRCQIVAYQKPNESQFYMTSLASVRARFSLQVCHSDGCCCWSTELAQLHVLLAG